MKKLILLVLIIAGCSPIKYLDKHPEICLLCRTGDSTMINSSTVITDTSYIQDPILFTAWLECDSSYNVVLKNSEVEKVTADKVRVSLQNDILTFKALLEKCKGKVIVKTVTQFREVTVREPINDKLKKDNDELKKSLASSEISKKRSRKFAINSIILNIGLLSFFAFLIYKKVTR